MNLKFAHRPTWYEFIASAEHRGKYFQLYLDKKHSQGRLLGDLGEYTGTHKDIIRKLDSLVYYGVVADLVELHEDVVKGAPK